MNSAARIRYVAPTMARVTTRYRAAWTTFWLVTRRRAAIEPTTPTTMKAQSSALIPRPLPTPSSRLGSGRPNGRGLGPPLCHPAVRTLGQLFREDPVVRLLVGLN